MAIEVKGREEELFDKIERNLEGMIRKLDNELTKTILGKGLDEAAIKSLLGEVDEQIIKNPQIQHLLIEGDKESAARIRTLINEAQSAISQKINQFINDPNPKLDMLSEEDAKKVQDAYTEKVQKSRTVTTQKELDSVEEMKIEVDSDKVRYDRYVSEAKKLEARIAKAKSYRENFGVGRVDKIKESNTRVIESVKKEESVLKSIDALGEPSEYEALANNVRTPIKNLRKRTRTPFKQIKIEEVNKRIGEVRRLAEKIALLNSANGGKDQEIKGLAEYLGKEVKSLDSIKEALGTGESKLSRLNQIVQKLNGTYKIGEINFDEKVRESKSSLLKSPIETLKYKIENELVFKLDPKKRKEFLDRIDGIKTGDIQTAKSELEKLIGDIRKYATPELLKSVEAIEKDAQNISQLQEDEIKYKNIAENLRKRYGAKVEDIDYSYIEVFGTKLKLPDGMSFEEIFNSDIDRDRKKEIVRGLREKIFEDPECSGKISEWYEECGQKPKGITGLFKSFLYPITHNGKTIEEAEKEKIANHEIKNAIREKRSLREEQKKTKKAWELSDEELEEFKRKEREAIVRDGKSAKDVRKKTVKTAKEQQTKEDEEEPEL